MSECCKGLAPKSECACELTEIDRLRAELTEWKEQFRVLAILEQQKTAALARSLEENKRVRKDYEIVTVDNAAADARIAQLESGRVADAADYEVQEENYISALSELDAARLYWRTATARAERAEARIAELEAAGNRLGDAAVDGVLTSIEAVTELAEAKARIAELAAERAKLSSFHDMLTKLSHALARAERAEARIAELEAKYNEHK